MTQWSHEQQYNNACQSFQNLYRYPPLFSERGMSDPRGLGPHRTPPRIVRPCPPMQPSPVGPSMGLPPSLPPFPRHIPPPSCQQLPNMNCIPNMASPFSALPGPFNRPPPQNGRYSVTQNIRHSQGFVPHWPPPNCPPVSLPCTNIPPPNYPPPTHPVRNYPPPAAAFNLVDHHIMAQRPVNICRQRLPGSMPFCNQRMDFRIKRQLNTEHCGGKVHAQITLLPNLH